MRYEKSENLLRLIVDLQNSRIGLTLDDIQDRYGVSRRTAERMRDAVGNLFSELERTNPGEIPKKWRISKEQIKPSANFTRDELSSLETACALLEKENLGTHKELLQSLSRKLETVLNYQLRVQYAPDLEALSEAEGLAMRPGPHPKIDDEVLGDLRKAVLACERIGIYYVSQGTGNESFQKVCPYGFLFGHRHYLVAWSRNPRARDYRLFVLGNIRKVDFLGESFERREDFNLREFAARSFGVFQEEPFDVVWKFSKKVAGEASGFLFHPSQTMEKQKDGTLLVKFHAGGWLEMCWHLFEWEGEVEVVEPRWLEEKYKELKAL